MGSVDSDTQRDKKKVVLADDHDIVRHAIQTILEAAGRYTIVGEAATADEAVEVVKDTVPDLLILDLGLPGKSGLEAIYEIKEIRLNTKIIVLSMYQDENKIRHAISAGAAGYLLKNSAPDEFLASLQRIERGEVCLPEAYTHIIEELFDGRMLRNSAKLIEDPLGKLSQRERQVFHMLANGLPNRDIARKLFISPRTVETHRARVIKKLGFSSTADLIRYAIRNDLMTLE